MEDEKCSFTIIDYGIRRRRVVSFTPLSLYSLEKFSRYQSNGILGGPQRQPMHYGERKNPLLLMGIELLSLNP
jgi:hypothetical protein